VAAIAHGADVAEWEAWLTAFGSTVRRVRTFLGLTQHQLAEIAGVSQGSISRVERLAAAATPLLTVVRVQTALRTALSAVDPSLLSPDLRRFIEGQPDVLAGALPATQTGAVVQDPVLDTVMQIVRRVPAAQRQAFLQIVEAAAAALLRPVESGAA
jgi:transcriptional regulator with XRE-family HTH domain